MADIFARIANLNNNKVHLTEDSVTKKLDKQEANQKKVQAANDELSRIADFISDNVVTEGEYNAMKKQLSGFGIDVDTKINANNSDGVNMKSHLVNYEHALYLDDKNAETTWDDSQKKVFEGITKDLERTKENLEGNESRFNFDVQMATSDLTTAEQARAAAIKKRDENRSTLQDKWTQ